MSRLHPRILVVFLLGISSGLPLPLVGSTLGARLAASGVDLGEIALFAYVMIPYSFKFAWAPLIDHLPLPFSRRLGQRRAWMLLAQALLVAAIVGLGHTDPVAAPFLTALFALAVAFLAASQDIVIDAYRTEYLPPEQHAGGAAAAVIGYRVGMLLGGAVALGLSDFFPWALVYTAMGACIVIGAATVCIAGEPRVTRPSVAYKGAADWMRAAVIAPFRQFAQAHAGWIVLLLFIASYRMSDGFIGFMSTPFFVKIGFSMIAIGTVGKVYGFFATLGGAVLGAALIRRLGLRRALFVGGIAQLATNLAYILVALAGPDLRALMLAVTLDNLAGGAVTVAAVAFLMRLCDPAHTATQYALLTALAALASFLLAGVAGQVAEHYGWVAMFTVSAIMGLPSLFLLAALRSLPALRS